MLYPIIIAGGQGTRLWPVSRKKSPKQIKPFLDGTSLLRKTYDRLTKSIPSENIFLSTGKHLLDSVKLEVPGLPDKNIVLEPVRRGTAAALGLALLKVFSRDKDATFVYINADNHIKNEEEYNRILKIGGRAIETSPQKVLLVGIKPTYPETGYGYIKTADNHGNIEGRNILNVGEFVEKPDLDTAKDYLRSGDYFWNPTLIIAKAEHFLNLYKKHLPDMYEKLQEISQFVGSPHEEDGVEEIFPQITPTSVDYGILEKEDDMLILPADFGWTDVGHWRAIWDMLAEGEDDNVGTGKHFHLEGRGNLVYSINDKLVTTIGLEDMLIVETDDAIMICPKDRAQDVKKIVKKLEEDGEDSYL